MTHMPVAHIYPKGTYRKKVFYSRGDDIYLEPEWTEKEKRNLQAKYKVICKDYYDLKQEYKEIENQLNDVDKCTIQIAERIGDESNSTTENAELRQQIKDLSKKVDNIHQEIESIQNTITPTSISYLLKELALFMPEYETNEVERNILEENIGNFEHALCELTACDEYHHSVLADAEYRISIQCRSNMKQHLQSTHKSIDGSPSAQNSVLTSSINALSQQKSDIMVLFDELIEQKLNKDEIDLQKELAATHKRMMIKTAVEEIEELNDLLSILGEEIVDINEVKENCDFDLIEKEEREIAERDEKSKQERNDRPLTQKRNRSSATRQTSKKTTS